MKILSVLIIIVSIGLCGCTERYAKDSLYQSFITGKNNVIALADDFDIEEASSMISQNPDLYTYSEIDIDDDMENELIVGLKSVKDSVIGVFNKDKDIIYGWFWNDNEKAWILEDKKILKGEINNESRSLCFNKEGIIGDVVDVGGNVGRKAVFIEYSEDIKIDIEANTYIIKIYDYKDFSKVIQEINAPIYYEAKNLPLKFDDVNFDGYIDMIYTFINAPSNSFSRVYLWDTDKFVENEAMMDISKISINKEKGIIEGFLHSSGFSGSHNYYSFIDNTLVCIRSLEWDLTVPYYAVYNNLNGELKEVFRATIPKEEVTYDEKGNLIWPKDMKDELEKWFDINYKG